MAIGIFYQNYLKETNKRPVILSPSKDACAGPLRAYGSTSSP